VIGDVRHVSRFPSRDHFAACNGTARVEVSSGGRKIYRLSLRGNRRLNHAIHMAAISQIRHKHSQGRAYYDKKLAEGKPLPGPPPPYGPALPQVAHQVSRTVPISVRPGNPRGLGSTWHPFMSRPG
jgi:hypothetical protein